MVFRDKIVCLMITIVMMVILTGCLSWPDTDTVQIESSTPINSSGPPMPDVDDLQYFDTIDKAVALNDLVETGVKRIDERIKLFENDEYAVLFFRSNLSGNDLVSTFKFIVKNIDGTHYYSMPVVVTNMSWEGHKWSVKKMKLDEIGEVRLCIAGDSLRWFRVDDSKNFFWGLAQTENVRNLKIEGQPVTEVISVELDGETGYFWYFDDLKTDKRPVFKDLRKYTEGEFVITMDE